MFVYEESCFYEQVADKIIF